MLDVTVKDMAALRLALAEHYAEGLNLIIDFVEFNKIDSNFTELKDLLTKNGTETIALSFTEKCNLVYTDIRKLLGLPSVKMKSININLYPFAEISRYVDNCKCLYDSLDTRVEIKLQQNKILWKVWHATTVHAAPSTLLSPPSIGSPKPTEAGDNASPLLTKEAAPASPAYSSTYTPTYIPPDVPGAAP